MVFYIFSPYKIEAYENKLSEFLADDLLEIINQSNTKIATNEEHFSILKQTYPNYNKYEVKVGKTG